MSKETKLQVLSIHRQLHLLSDWVRSQIKPKGITQTQLAEVLGVSASTIHVKFHKGMTYADVEKIAEFLNVPKPDLAKATLLTLQQEIRDLSGTPEAEEYGIVPVEQPVRGSISILNSAYGIAPTEPQHG